MKKLILLCLLLTTTSAIKNDTPAQPLKSTINASTNMGGFLKNSKTDISSLIPSQEVKTIEVLEERAKNILEDAPESSTLDPSIKEEKETYFTLNSNRNDGPAAAATAGGYIIECAPDMITFEIVTGYVFSAPGKLLNSLPGTLMLTDCLEACQKNEICNAVNYETGLCVLFSENADRFPGALTKSQFPVFTIYAQKACLDARPCARAWVSDRVQNFKLKGHTKRSLQVASRQKCLSLCLTETEFTCRSANYYLNSNTCELSAMDRFTLADANAFQTSDDSDYLENNCADEPNKLCEFKRISGRILKTVDSVFQDIGSIEECRNLCLNSQYRCHSYDYGDTGDMVCRLSHHSRSTLFDIQEPYLEVPEASTYELSSCYNVSIECGSGDMIARVRTSKLFDGKLYAKGSPKSCSIDVIKSLEFELRMGFHDIECNVRQSSPGRYMNDVVIQHHDTIVTSSDLGLAVTCQYDLTNKSVSNEVDLQVKMDMEPALSEEVIVDSPNVVMKITSRDGLDIKRSAEVGDPLALKFEILDDQSPYEIFVRELVAMDGIDNAEITLIDSNGCPTDHLIMGPINKMGSQRKVLMAQFDAFKFPSSELVQFRALITPCIPTCEPIQCNVIESTKDLESLVSYGRRKRSLQLTGNFKNLTKERKVRETSPLYKHDDMLLVQSIQITDKFGFERQQQNKAFEENANNTVFLLSDSTKGFCANAFGVFVATLVLLFIQLIIIFIWVMIQQRRQKLKYNSTQNFSSRGSSSGSNNAHNIGSDYASKSYEQNFFKRSGTSFKN